MGFLGSIISSIFNTQAQRDINEQNIFHQDRWNQMNIDFQQQTNQQNIQQQWDMWNATNDYNSPVNQMKRYRAAGLNPNLIYGQSNTTSPVNVGISNSPSGSAPQIDSPKINIGSIGNIAGMYLDLISKKKQIERQDIENDILSRTADDKVTQSNLKTQQMGAQIKKIGAEVERIGMQNTLTDLESQIKQFDIDLQPLIRSLKENEVNVSNNNVSMLDIYNKQQTAQMKISEFQIYLMTADYLLKNAQSEHELKKIGVTEQNKKYLEQQIKESQSRINQIASNINLNQSNLYLNQLKYDHEMVDYLNPFRDIPIIRGIGTMISSPVYETEKLINYYLNN